MVRHAKSILLVEDEVIVAFMLHEILTDESFAVRMAPNGDEACGAIDAGSFDLLITDIRMPGRDGWAVARHAREANPSVRVIYMSGDSAVNHAAHGVPDSVMLTKPFAHDDFVAVVKLALEDEVGCGEPGNELPAA